MSINTNDLSIVDINECTTGTDNCDKKHGICTDNPGSYCCKCKTGYSGDGRTCKGQ